MTGLIEVIAAKHNAELTVLHPTTLKKFATGSGRAVKDEMIALAKERCLVPVNDEHQADAYWLYMLWKNNWDNKNG
jgi:Holliday junction resolvasome RuvABC endonuclease subunit